VRQALDKLCAAGLVRREQGRGTFVAEPKIEQGPRDLTGFTQEMYKRGLRASSKILTQEAIKADGELAEKLKLEEGDDVLLLKRLRLADGEAMGIQMAYIPLALAPNLAAENFESASLYEILERKYGLVPARASETHSAVLLDSVEAGLLGVAEDSPGLAAERVTFLNSGRPLELVRSVMRGDRYKIVLQLVRVTTTTR
jgi:GntR family transcriptional regulator